MNGSRVVIEPASDEHRDVCERLWRHAHLEMFHMPGAPGEGDFAIQTRGEELHVARDEDLVCGFVSIWRPEPFVHSLVVAEDYRRCGIGTLLLRRVVSLLSTPIQLKCETQNVGACRFYEADGWLEVDRTESVSEAYVLYQLDIG